MPNHVLDKKIVRLGSAVFFLIAASAVTVYFVDISGVYPRGYDVMYHMYRSASLLESIQNGDWYPLYDKYLYNGVQVMRYWAPVPVYVLSLCNWVTGSLMNGYLLYLGFVLFLGGSGWLLFGWKHDRLAFAAVVGTIWFFIPDNLRVLFDDGNLPRALIAALLPWLMYYILEFIEDRKIADTITIVLIISMMSLCHLGETSIIIICLIIFFVVFAITQRKLAELLWIIPGIGISFLLIGIWLYPSIHGGLLSIKSSDEDLKSSFANGWDSLNPFFRFHDIGAVYFGLTLFIVCILGILVANKKTKPGFITGLIIYFGTTLSFFPLISNLPFGHLFWMKRFITFAMVTVFISLFLWKEMKRVVVIILCIMISIDCIPSLGYIYVPEDQRIADPVQAQAELAKKDGLDILKGQTRQRTAVMDLSSYGSFAPYYLAGEEPYTQGTFGAAWQSAATARNIVQLNTAFTLGNYDYLFDRCLELGNDTILIRVYLMKNAREDIEKVVAAGRRLGYQRSYQDDEMIIFSREIRGGFGVKTSYPAIAIGDSSRDIALRYPLFKETTDGNLNHYRYEELKNYAVIYLSGFTYDDKEKAEGLIRQLAEHGNRIYIDMNRIPVDESTKLAEFFNIRTQPISFQESFPSLLYKKQEYIPYPFAETSTSEESTWNTVYLTGLRNATGFYIFEGKKIAYYGKGKDENIYFIGFNLPFHVLTSSDPNLGTVLDDMLGMEANALPERRLAPVQIEYSNDMITVQSDEDGVNTTLAYHDIFRSDQTIKENNNLLTVDRGITRINLVYPYLKEGLLMSLAGFILMIGYLIVMRRYYQKRNNPIKETDKK